MRRAGIWLALALLAVAAPLEAAPPAEPPPPAPVRLELEEAWRLALARSPRIEAALARVEQAREGAEVAAAPARPQVSVNGWREQVHTAPGPPMALGGYTPLRPAGDGLLSRAVFQSEAIEYGDTQVQLEMRQLLFDGGQVEARIAEARAYEGQAEAALAGTVRDLRLELERTWLDVLEARSRTELVEEAEALSREQQAMAEARFEAGAAARADVVFARVPVARAELDRLRVGSDAATAQAALNRLLGLPLGTPLLPGEPSPPRPIPGSVEEAEQEARVRRPEVAQARADLEAAARAVEAAEAGNDPRLYAVGSTNGVAYNEEVLPVDYGWRVALEARWQLFDGNASAHEARRARARVREAEARLRDAGDAAALEVRQAWLGVQTADQAFETARVEVERAQEALSMAQGRYRNGVAVFLEVSQAQVDLLGARSRRTTARYDALRARARLEWARGGDPPVEPARD